MATYKVDTTDERLTSIEAQRDKEVSTSNKQFDNMMDGVESQYQGLIGQVEADRKNQEKVANENTEFAIDKIEQQKGQAKEDYLKQQSGAYTDWQKQSNQYGVEAEKQAAAGLAGTGYSESSLVSMYNQYQHRVASARQAYDRIILDYNNAITEAKLQNNSLLAEIASETLAKKLKLTLEGFQYKNNLLLQKANTERDIRQNWQSVYQNMMNTIMDEYRLNEQARQADLANQRELDRIKIAQDELKLQQEKYAFEKAQIKKAEQEAEEKGDNSGGDGNKKETKKDTKKYSGGTGISESAKGNSNGKTTTGKSTSAYTKLNMDSLVKAGLAGKSASELNAMIKAGKIKEYKIGDTLYYKTTNPVEQIVKNMNYSKFKF